ncbi:MAG: right-handed parallel beta-helix repeat-containing protein, partial [Pseudoxanthomonas mexicana]|nr:right-handed parallel beta-helix repeat-containing protein [Pseudoxanthomonas mexicana]
DLSANPQYYESIRGIVRNNVVRNTGYSGIGMYASKDAIVANNTIINAGRLGHSALYFGVTFQDWDPNAGRPANTNPTLRNNLVIQDNNRCVEIRYASDLGGLSGLAGSPNSNWNGFGNGCVFRDGRPGSTVTAGTLAQWRSGTGADANSKQAAFSVDATGRLPAGSPAIDSGTTLAAVTDDIDRQTRVAPYDLGADEYGGQSAAPIRVNGVQPLIPVRGSTASSTAVTAGSAPTSSASTPAPTQSITASTGTTTTVSTAKPAAGPAVSKYTPPAWVAWRWLLARLGWLQ